jgi:hypothetical protein
MDRWVVPKRRYEINATRCVIEQNIAVLTGTSLSLPE